jgi:murein DD-endopeptidase MepM/ murein hydrolase activator NlpD
MKGKPMTFTILKPVNDPITSPFGMRTHPVTGKPKFHFGVDFGCPENTIAIAPTDSRVVVQMTDPKGFGKFLILRAYIENTTWYWLLAHLNEYLCQIDELITRGQQVAKTGNTGLSTGAHLHFQCMKSSFLLANYKTCCIDPLTLFEKNIIDSKEILDKKG